MCHLYSSLKSPYFKAMVEVNPPNKPDIVFLKKTAPHTPDTDHSMYLIQEATNGDLDIFPAQSL